MMATSDPSSSGLTHPGRNPEIKVSYSVIISVAPSQPVPQDLFQHERIQQLLREYRKETLNSQKNKELKMSQISFV